MSVTATPKDEAASTDAIVVFTGGSDRIEAGLALFAAGRSPHLFVSGVNPEVKKSEILALWNGDSALPSCCVDLGYEATNTVQNAIETREWVESHDYQSLRLVTGSFHMVRSAMELQEALPDVEIYEHPITQNDHPLDSLHYWQLMLSEYHKTLFRKTQIYFEENAG